MHMVPQLQKLDGYDITPTDKITAAQNFTENQHELYVKAEKNIRDKSENPVDPYDETLFTPQTRISMAQDTAKQNEEKQNKKCGERDQKNLDNYQEYIISEAN